MQRRWCPGDDVRLAAVLPGTAGKRAPVSRFPGAPLPALANAANDSKLRRAAVSSGPREGDDARSGGLPGGGGAVGPRTGVNPTAGGSAGTEGWRTCPAGDCPPAWPVQLTGGQDFLARPRARPRDNDSAPRGPLMDLSRACRRPAVDLTPRRRAGCGGQISLSPAHPRGEGHSQMEGFPIEGGSTPYPHIALCAIAPTLIYSRRTGRTPSDVQKRCLPPRAAAGPGAIQWPEPGLTASATDSNPRETTWTLVIARSDRSHGR